MICSVFAVARMATCRRRWLSSRSKQTENDARHSTYRRSEYCYHHAGNILVSPMGHRLLCFIVHYVKFLMCSTAA